MKELRANLRAARRVGTALAGIPVLLGLMALQGFVVGPLTGNYHTIPKFLYKCMGKICGYKVVFNKVSAPIVKDKPVWFVANHQSIADFIVLGSTLKGTFAGKGDILKWRIVGVMARGVNYIGLRRSADKNLESMAKIAKNFNRKFNTIMFPEATTTPTRKLALFRAPLFTMLFGVTGVDKKKKEVPLEMKPVVQPVAVCVKEVEGRDATKDDTLHYLYGMYNEEKTLSRVWKRFKVKNITVEVTVFPPLDPADYHDADALTNAKSLINKAALEIASVVNPGQTTFEKAVIPDQPAKAAAPLQKAP